MKKRVRDYKHVLKIWKKRLTALVDEKVENATKVTCKKLEKSVPVGHVWKFDLERRKNT